MFSRHHYLDTTRTGATRAGAAMRQRRCANHRARLLTRLPHRNSRGWAPPPHTALPFYHTAQRLRPHGPVRSSIFSILSYMVSRNIHISDVEMTAAEQSIADGKMRAEIVKSHRGNCQNQRRGALVSSRHRHRLGGRFDDSRRDYRENLLRLNERAAPAGAANLMVHDRHSWALIHNFCG